MKYFIPLLLCSVLLACGTNDKGATAGNGARNSEAVAEKAMKDSANYTQIQWLDSTEQSVGTIEEGQVVEISWHFKNTGNKPLVIASVRPGCGCTLAEKPEAPIAPGKEGVIKAKFDSNGHPNVQHKTVEVQANNSNRNGGNVNLLAFTAIVNPKK